MGLTNLKQMSKLKHVYDFFLNLSKEDCLGLSYVKMFRSGTDGKILAVLPEWEDEDKFIEILNNCSSVDFGDADDETGLFEITFTIPDVYTEE